MSPKSLSDGTVSSCVDGVDIWCPSYVVFYFANDIFVLTKELFDSSLLLFRQLFRKTAHHLLDYVDFRS